MQEVLPERSHYSIKRAMRQLIERGEVPKQNERRSYTKLKLMVHQAAWLAGILDGEGTIHLRQQKRLKNGWGHGYAVQLSLCYNTDYGIIERVSNLIPHARVIKRPDTGIERKDGKPKKTCWVVLVSGYVQILDVLDNLLPHMASTEKREKAVIMVGFIRSRLGV